MRAQPLLLLYFVAGAFFSLTFCGCSHFRDCNEREHTLDESEWEIYGRWAKTAVMSNIYRRNAPHIIGGILYESSIRKIRPVPEIEFVVRGDFPTREPVYGRLSGQQLIDYYRMGKRGIEVGKWEWEVIEKLPVLTVPNENRTFAEVFRFVCKEIHYSRGWLSENQGFFLRPQEIGDAHDFYQRRAYQLPCKRKWFDSASFPSRLPPCGVGCGFDAPTGLLVIIGEADHLCAFECLLKAIGADLVYSSVGLPW